MTLQKRLEEFGAKRLKVYSELFSARSLCIAAVFMTPALLFNPSTFGRVLQFLLFWFFSWLSGKKNNPFFTILVIIGIVAFNLIIPYGRVLFSLGPFRITAGALETGIRRAVTLEGLIMLSRVTIRQDLKIPGFFGELIGESFRILALIMSRKQRLSKNLIADLDRLMMELSDASGEFPQPLISSGAKPAGLVILGAIVILSWLPWAVR